MILKLVSDDKIPFIGDFFTQCDDIILIPGEKIAQKDLMGADILLTRTVTPVNSHLLKNTSIKFVGTATTGTDHVDTDWLAAHHIFLATAQGANATAVVEYVTLCCAALKKNGLFHGNNTSVGIIGCGRIGSALKKFFEMQNHTVLCYDPFLPAINNASLEKLMRESNLITLHTPLTKTGPHPTYHMIDVQLINKMKKHAVLINTARGSVIDQQVLLSNKPITLCLDVWENEPAISLALLKKVFIGTPHIAGYSLDAKWRATKMIYEQAAAFFGWNDRKKNISPEKNTSTYDPVAHTQRFRAAFQGIFDPEKISEIFTRERGTYPLR